MTVFVISLVRTFVPTVVGALFVWLASFGIEVPEDGRVGLTSFLFVLFTGLYYLVVRLLEERFPQLGILLGFAKSPDSYTKGPGVELTSKPNGNPEITVTVSDPAIETQATDVYVNRATNGPDHRIE
jgi:hypothetical protein